MDGAHALGGQAQEPDELAAAELAGRHQVPCARRQHEARPVEQVPDRRESLREPQRPYVVNSEDARAAGPDRLQVERTEIDVGLQSAQLPSEPRKIERMKGAG